MTKDDYNAVGGLDEALSRDADRAYESLSEEQKRIAEVLFRRLTVRDAGRRDTRRQARLDDVAAVAGLTAGDIKPIAEVIEVFRHPDRSFIVPLTGPLKPDTQVDISHESLIQRWVRLKRWIDDEARSADTYRRLLDDAKHWKNGAGEVWRGRSLQRAFDWQVHEKPTPEWAARYSTVSGEGVIDASSKDLELVKEFLVASQKQQRREKRLQRILRLSVWCLGIGLVISVLFLVYSYDRQRKERAWRERLESLNRICEEEKRRADQEEQEAEAAEQKLAAASREDFGGSAPVPENNMTADALGLSGKGQPIRPGASFGLLNGPGSGSICCVVRDQAGAQYILSVSYVLYGAVGSRVIQPGSIDGGKAGDVIATITHKGKDSNAGALARIMPGKDFNNVVPGVGKITGIADQVKEGDEVWLIGRTSGLVKGRVIAVEPEKIITTRISSPGDGGAPVLTSDGRLVGLLGFRDVRGSSVIPIGPIIRELKVELVP